MAKVIYALVEEVYAGSDRFNLMRDPGLSKETLYESIVTAREALVSLYMQNGNKTYLGVPVQYKDIRAYEATIIYQNNKKEIHRIFSVEHRIVY